MIESILRVLTIVTLAVLIGAGSARAVGYERQSARHVPIVKHITKVHGPTGLRGAAREATPGQRVPAALDKAAVTVRNLMSQFGLLDKKAP